MCSHEEHKKIVMLCYGIPCPVSQEYRDFSITKPSESCSDIILEQNAIIIWAQSFVENQPATNLSKTTTFICREMMYSVNRNL